MNAVSWRERLAEERARKNAKGPPCIPTKPTKPLLSVLSGSRTAISEKTSAPPEANADPAQAALRDMRTRLLSLASRALVAPELVRRIPAAYLRTLIEVATGDAWLMSYLHGIGTLAELRSGRLPLEYDTPARCTHCGPVWLPAATVAGLDAAGGLPLVHGCPWCFVTLPKGMGIPRPIYPRSEP